MARPLRVIPRGPKRDDSYEHDRLVFSCPRVSPEFQFRAFIALLKPQFKTGVAHRSGRQRLPRNARKLLDQSIERLVRTPALRPEVQLHRDTDQLFTIEFDPRRARVARAVAVDVSARLPNLWFLFDGRMLHGGRFYRRQGRYRLVPVSMRVPRLPRDVYLAMVGALDAPDPNAARYDQDEQPQ